MSVAARPGPIPEGFRLRAASYSLLTLRLLSPRLEEVLPALGDQLRRAPGFLRFAPIAIGLEELGEARLDFVALVRGLRSLDILPVGVVGGSQALRADAAAAGLPTLRPAGQREGEVQTGVPAAVPVALPPPTAAAAPAPAPAAASGARTLVVARSLRAGQRVHAEGGDLVVIGSVNPGAEAIADGHVHVYGALRGRAVAGAREDPEARIFAQVFDPELVAIAGFYAVREGLAGTPLGRGAMVRLEGEELRFSPLG